MQVVPRFMRTEDGNTFYSNGMAWFKGTEDDTTVYGNSKGYHDLWEQ